MPAGARWEPWGLPPGAALWLPAPSFPSLKTKHDFEFGTFSGCTVSSFIIFIIFYSGVWFL